MADRDFALPVGHTTGVVATLRIEIGKTFLLCILIVFTSINSGAQENNIVLNNGDCTCQNDDPIKYNYMPTLQRTVKYNSLKN